MPGWGSRPPPLAAVPSSRTSGSAVSPPPRPRLAWRTRTQPRARGGREGRRPAGGVGLGVGVDGAATSPAARTGKGMAAARVDRVGKEATHFSTESGSENTPHLFLLNTAQPSNKMGVRG